MTKWGNKTHYASGPNSFWTNLIGVKQENKKSRLLGYIQIESEVGDISLGKGKKTKTAFAMREYGPNFSSFNQKAHFAIQKVGMGNLVVQSALVPTIRI